MPAEVAGDFFGCTADGLEAGALLPGVPDAATAEGAAGVVATVEAMEFFELFFFGVAVLSVFFFSESLEVFESVLA